MRPPMCPPTEMTLDSPKVSSRLMTSTPSTGLLRMLMPRLRPRASTAPIRPKMAPEAPTVSGVGRDDERTQGAAEQRHEVHDRELHATHRLLDQAAEDPERVHVEREVDEAVVEEPGRDEPVPLTLGDAVERAPVEGALGEQPAVLDQLAGAVERVGAGHDDAEQEDGDVHGDQDLGQDRLVPGKRRRAPVHLLSALLHALRAVEPDRGLVHAGRADGPVAALADHPGGLAGVAVAGAHRRRRRRGKRLCHDAARYRGRGSRFSRRCRSGRTSRRRRARG